jgi:hypothetical protein
VQVLEQQRPSGLCLTSVRRLKGYIAALNAFMESTLIFFSKRFS